MAPSSVLGVVGNGITTLDIGTGKNLGDWDKLALERVTSETNGLSQSGKISIVITRAGVEVVVGDGRDIQGVSRSQGDGASSVARMSLQNSPGEPIMLAGGIVSVTWEVATEVDGSTKDEDIVLIALGGRALVEHGSTETGRSVDTTVAKDRLVPAVEASVSTFTESAAIEGREVRRSLALYVDLVVILEVGTDTGQVLDDRNVELAQLVRRSNTAKLQELR